MDKRKIVAKKRFENVHKELLGVGEKLLNTKNLTEITLNSITDYTEVSKTTIYEHFTSLDSFLAGVVQHVYEKMTSEFRSKKEGDPKQNIKTMFIDYKEFVYKNPNLGKNIYASFVMLSGSDKFPKINLYEDLEKELDMLGLDNEEKKIFLKKFNFSIDDFRNDLENGNTANIDLLINDLTFYLEKY